MWGTQCQRSTDRTQPPDWLTTARKPGPSRSRHGGGWDEYLFEGGVHVLLGLPLSPHTAVDTRSAVHDFLQSGKERERERDGGVRGILR